MEVCLFKNRNQWIRTTQKAQIHAAGRGQRGVTHIFLHDNISMYNTVRHSRFMDCKATWWVPMPTPQG